MKDKHIKIRIQQCLALAEASNCTRRKFGALLLDPVRNVVLADGYNGGPRGGHGHLCGGDWCVRDGLTESQVQVTTEKKGEKWKHDMAFVLIDGKRVFMADNCDGSGLARAQEFAAKLLEEVKPIPSGTSIEKGCHHAEMNVLCNAAANGTKTDGAWLIVTGEPCLMCAKLMHHAGIAKVLVVDGGYMGPNGVAYLHENGVAVEKYDGPKDPRAEKKE